MSNLRMSTIIVLTFALGIGCKIAILDPLPAVEQPRCSHMEVAGDDDEVSHGLWQRRFESDAVVVGENNGPPGSSCSARTCC